MSGPLKNRLYEMEVTPPEEVWKKLSAALDEINADNRLAGKIYNREIQPPGASWNIITAALDEKHQPAVSSGGGRLILLKRLAVAAAIIGVLLSAYFIFLNTGNRDNEIAEETASPSGTKEIKIPGNQASPEYLNKDGNQTNQPLFTDQNSNKSLTLANQNNLAASITRKSSVPVNIALIRRKTTEKEKIGEKIFKEPIDDLSVIASGDDYYTMVNANGRMVKIPARLTGIASYLQDKPVVDDYFEMMFGEGAYWKGKLKDWRHQAVTSLQTPSAGSFFDIINLLRSAQDN
jgi:hypothetical protein